MDQRDCRGGVLMQTVQHFGESIEVSRLVRHYRDMARGSRFPNRRELYRDLLRSVIRQFREQRAEQFEQREAA